jgi:hypothetical protein
MSRDIENGPKFIKEYLWREHEPVGDTVDFRLTYAGPLYADSRSARDIAKHKQDLRKHFHGQLRGLWEERPHIQQILHHIPDGFVFSGPTPPETRPRSERLAERFQRNGYRFVPLVTADLALSCALEILFLLPEPREGLFRAGTWTTGSRRFLMD